MRPTLDSREARAERRRKRRKRGVCVECGGDPYRKQRRCKVHRALNNRLSKLGHARARKEGRE